MKYTQKALKALARQGVAKDITDADHAEIDALRRDGLTSVAVSKGMYGMNGALLTDNDGKMYVITARNCALFAAV